MNQLLSRRSVLQTSVAVAAAGSLHGFSARSYANILGANDAVRIGVIGFNSRGNSHIDAFGKMKGVRLVALCDADEDVLARGVKRVESGPAKKASKSPSTKPATRPIAKTERKAMVAEGVTPGHAPEPSSRPATKLHTFADLRKLLDSKEIDAISTATPNHWHSLITVWACQAGKDVYVEKPVSHEVWEGRQMVEAARKYNRIVQTGTQARSNPALKAAYEWVQAGNLGKIQVVRGLCYKRRGSIGKTEGDQPVPKSVNYDLWLGPAAMEQPHRKQFHYDWHWQWAYGSGDLGNQGIHQMDTSRWASGKNHLAPKVFSIGGRFGYEDDGQTPNTQFVVQDYGDSMIIFEVRGLPKATGSSAMDKYRGESVGTVVECENGYLTDSGYSSEPVAYDKDGKAIKKFKRKGEDRKGGEDAEPDTVKSAAATEGEQENGDHFGNFIKAVRSRDLKDLNADILEGHLSSALCHTGNISYQLGKPTPAGEIENVLKDNKAAAETYARFKEHLAANDIELKDKEATVGAFLEMDPTTERFTNNEKANALLKRQYRAPFVVPDQV